MFNRIKKCTCGYYRKYDVDKDFYEIDGYRHCPKCGSKLKTEKYSPDI